MICAVVYNACNTETKLTVEQSFNIFCIFPYNISAYYFVKLKPLLSCKIAEIAMKGLFLLDLRSNDDIMRPEPTLVYVMQYNPDILIIVVVTQTIKQVLGLKCINT